MRVDEDLGGEYGVGPACWSWFMLSFPTKEIGGVPSVKCNVLTVKQVGFQHSAH